MENHKKNSVGRKIVPVIISILILLYSCSKEVSNEESFPALMEIPGHFPAVPQPADNQFTMDRWSLGKRLFYDPLFSFDSTVSCGSCHRQKASFSDDKALSAGAHDQLTTFNVPPLINLAYQPYYTGAGGVPTIEMQVLVPIQEHNEFDFNMPGIVKRIKNIPEYVSMSRKAFGREPDAYVVTRALGCFERSLISAQSKYDRYRKTGDRSVLSPEAFRGMELFNSEKCGCSKCHSGVNFSNYAFENNGLFTSNPEDGRYRVTLDARDMGKYKVPTLRNIEYSAPYMHDGSIATLEEVIRRYEAGGSGYPTQSPLIKGFQLTDSERNDLISFLKSLSDPNFVKNPQFAR